MSAVAIAKEARELGRGSWSPSLTHNGTITPPDPRLNREQAAAYFMLGETQGTSAGGKDEMGKFLRVPGTNPFFPLLHAMMGNRFLQLLDDAGFEVFLLNPARIRRPP